MKSPGSTTGSSDSGIDGRHLCGNRVIRRLHAEMAFGAEQRSVIPLKDYLSASVETWLAEEMGIVINTMGEFIRRAETVSEELPLVSYPAQDVPRFLIHMTLEFMNLLTLCHNSLHQDKRGLLHVQQLLERGGKFGEEFVFKFGGFTPVTLADDGNDRVLDRAVSRDSGIDPRGKVDHDIPFE